jgi:hypothetical protein
MAGESTATGTNVNTTTPFKPVQTGTESSLSSWAGPYVTEMLGRGQALAGMPYQTYQGPLTAGPSSLQNQAFSGIAGLTIPTDQMKAFTPTSFTSAGTAQQYMNPFLDAALQPQIDAARREAEISRQAMMGRMARAGSYGGGRQAVAEGLSDEALQRNLSNITGQGYRQAFDVAQGQFNTEQQREAQAIKDAQQYGLGVLGQQLGMGSAQRGIEQEGVAADYDRFKEQRDFPYKQVQYMQSLLQGLPLAAQSYSYSQPSALSEILGGAGGLRDLYNILFPSTTPATTTPPATTTTPTR